MTTLTTKNYYSPVQIRSFVEQEIKENPLFNEYVNFFGYEMEGAGWSLAVKPCYGLTFKGIEQILLEKNIPAKSCETTDEIVESLDDSSSRLFVISTRAFYRDDQKKANHAICLVVEKIDALLRLYIVDSYGESHFSSDKAACAFAETLGYSNCSLEVYECKVKKQPSRGLGSTSCYAFAIYTIQKLGENFEYLELARKGAQRLSEVRYQFSELPEECFLSGIEAAKQACNYQLRLMEYARDL